jgi:WD40 repeat protein/tRNA A-37 threonylcarbamoyl transferase component Bud32
MKIGPHEVVAEIGRGGIGVVYKARTPDGREVAIKLLQRLDANRTQRFERERRLLASLGEGEGFVPLLEAGESERGPYLVMPFVAGGTLTKRLQFGALPAKVVAELGVELGRALGRAHGVGIVHRDMKPDNVIFSQDGSRTGEWGRPLILDLGLAKHFRREATTVSVSLSKTGESMGTIAYMAPEQAANTKAVDARADVFSLGAILYECLAGEPAFEGDTTLEVFGRIQSGNFTPLRKKCPNAPRWLAEIVERALDVNPERRFADGDALARALASRDSGTRRRLALPVAAGLALALALGLGAAAHSFEHDRPPPPPAPPAARPSPLPTPSPPPAPAAPELPVFDTQVLKIAAVWGRHAGRHAGMVLDVAISADGKLVASSSMDATVRVWDPRDLRPLHLLRGDAPFDAVRFVPGSHFLLAAGRDQKVRLWDVDGEREMFRLEGHTDEVHGLAVTSDGQRAVTGSSDKRLGVWDLGTGKLIRWLEGHEGTVLSVAIAPGDRTAVSSGADGTIRVWDLEAGALIATSAKVPTRLVSGDLSPDGKTFVCGADDQLVRLFSVATGELLRTLEGHATRVFSAVFSPDGQKVLSASADGTMRIFSADTGATERVITGHDNWVSQARFFPDGKTIVSGSNDATVRLWDAATGSSRLPAPVGHLGACTCLALTADGKRAVTGGNDAVVRVWDTASGTETKALRGHEIAVHAVGISGDGRRVLSGGGAPEPPPRAELILWDVETAAPRKLAGPTLPVTALALAPDGKHAASAGSLAGHGEAFGWKLEGEPASTPVRGAEVGVATLSYAPDGINVFAGTARGPQVWDLESFEAAPLSGSTKAVTAIVTDEQFALAAEIDGPIVGWDRGNPVDTIRFEGLHGATLALAMARDRKHVVSVGYDGVLHLWSFERRSEIEHIDFAPRGELPRAIAFSPDGKSLFVATTLGVILRFDVRGR